MLASEELDAVDICSPRETHAQMVRMANRRGLDILCQKPLGVDLGEARAVVEETTASRLMVHENWRFRAYYRVLKAWLEEGLAGPVRQVAFEFLSSGMIPGPDGQRPALVRQPFFRTQQRLLVMKVLIHHLDTLRFLFGEFEVASARLERSNAEIVAEDIASIVLRRTDGLLLTVTGSLAVHGQPPAPRDHLRIFGARNTIELLAPHLTVTGLVQRSELFDPDATYQGSYSAAIAHFLDRLEDGGEFETSPQDNLRTLALVEEIYRLSGFDPKAGPR